MTKPIWGAATSAHQVEGENRGNDWWAWEQAGRVSEKSGRACDHYRLFREDFRLARSLGHTAHRFSLEWSRLEPSEGVWSEEAFRHYEEVLETLESENLEPVVTLHHFTNPRWFAETGGWLRPDASQKFRTYAQRIAERFGRRVKFWITLNEPLVYIYHSFITGQWPPGEKSFQKALRVLRALLRAHTLAYQALHGCSKNQDCWVSIAHHTIAFSPCRPSSVLDRLSTLLRSWFVNLFVIEVLHSRKALDYIGANYYSRDFVRSSGFGASRLFGEVCPKDHHRSQVGAVNDLGWEIYPRGIYEVLISLRRFGLPVLVTENGICTTDDSLRERFIREHLGELRRSREEGVSIFGYLYWSLVDNFEWAEGFHPRFGIVEVNYENEARQPRPSAQTLREGCEQLFKGN